jgi:hypothetical protein
LSCLKQERKEVQVAKDSGTKSEVNWTAIGVGVIVIGAGVIALKIVRTLTGPTPEEQKEIDQLIEMWKDEFGVFKPYIESIYTPGHTPTDQEIAVLNSMMEGMRGKEQTIVTIHTQGWPQIVPVIKEIGSTAWQISLSVVVAGFAIVTLAYLFKKIRRPPSSWNCPKCGKHFGSAEELGTHVMDDHMIVLESAGQAQQSFNQTSPWVQDAVAVQSAYYGYAFADWRGYMPNELRSMAAATAIVYAAGIAAAMDMALLQAVLSLVLI